MKFIATVEKTDTGFSSYIDNLGVYSTGNSITDLKNNLIEALELLFEEEEKAIKPNQIDLQIDLQQFFQYYRVLNASFLAERIGMNPTLLSQYVRGNKKPSNKQTRKILDGIQEIGRELSEINLIH